MAQINRSQGENLMEVTLKSKEIDNDAEERDKQNINKEYVDMLNNYNEIKDATQVILGFIADIEGVTIKKVHEKFQLPLED